MLRSLPYLRHDQHLRRARIRDERSRLTTRPFR